LLQQLRQRYHRLLAGRRSSRRLADAVDFLIGNPILTVRELQAGLELADFKTAQRYVDVLAGSSRLTVQTTGGI